MQQRTSTQRQRGKLSKHNGKSNSVAASSQAKGEKSVSNVNTVRYLIFKDQQDPEDAYKYYDGYHIKVNCNVQVRVTIKGKK